MSAEANYFKYLMQRAETRAASCNYNHASVALKIAEIEERLAELKSQEEPLRTLMGLQIDEREKLCAAAHYVVCGRIPKDVQ
jgi:hypothetical protein